MTDRSPALLTRDFGLLVGAHFMASLGFASMLLLPLYLDWLGASRAEIGGLMAAASISGLATRPAVAWALDTVGRKPTLLLGISLGAAGLGAVWFVHDTGPVAWAMRLLFGLGEGALFSAFFTFVADIIPEQRRTEGIALFGVSGLLPLSISPLSALVGIHPSDLRWFLPAVGLAMALSALPLVPLPEPRRHVERADISLRGALSSLAARPTWSVWTGTVLFAGMSSVFMSFATVMAADRGVSLPGGLWLTYSLGAAGVRILGARLPDRLGTSNLVAPSLAVYALALVLAARARTDAGFFLAGALAGLGHGYCFPVLTSQVISRVPERYRGSGLSTFTALFGVSALVSSPTLGALADRFGDAWMFSATALLMVAGIAGWAALERGAASGSSAPPAARPSQALRP